MDTKLEWNQLHRSELWGRRGWEELKENEIQGRARHSKTNTVNSSILSIKITPRTQILLKDYFSAHTRLQRAEPQSLVTGCKCPNTTQNNRHQGWLQQGYRSVLVLPVSTRKRQLLKCSCTSAIIVILQSVTSLKAKGLCSTAQLGQLKEEQDFSSCSSDGHLSV